MAVNIHSITFRLSPQATVKQMTFEYDIDVIWKEYEYMRLLRIMVGLGTVDRKWKRIHRYFLWRIIRNFVFLYSFCLYSKMSGSLPIKWLSISSISTSLGVRHAIEKQTSLFPFIRKFVAFYSCQEFAVVSNNNFLLHWLAKPKTLFTNMLASILLLLMALKQVWKKRDPT